MTIDHQQPYAQATSGRDLLLRHVASLKELVSDLDMDALEQVAELLDGACLQGNMIYCIGNGGSAATASHLATDLSWGRRSRNQARPRAVSLVANVPLMTALSNDAGYEEVFVEQLRGLLRDGDVVLAISASGNSENVLRAVTYANEHGGISIGLTGFDGGKLKTTSKACVHVQTPTGSYELVEDVHHAVCHMLSSYLKFKAAHRSESNGQALQ